STSWSRTFLSSLTRLNATPAAPAISQSLSNLFATPIFTPRSGEHWAKSATPALATTALPSIVLRPAIGRTRRSLPPSTSMKNGELFTAGGGGGGGGAMGGGGGGGGGGGE